MAPTVTAAVIYSQEHLTLDNKLRKPMVEKMRRDRINSSIEQLKSLLSQEFLSQHPDSKLEKADILEMTVSFLRQQRHHQPEITSSCSADENEGFFRCVQEIVCFLSREDVKTQSQMRLLRHFQTMQPSSGKSRGDSVLSCQSSPARHTAIKEKTPVNSALWRPW
ncbi:transcription factor HES-5-like [Paramormyrops kingsleyae]|uniref:transcription factor HES-5-like n=1 Tax=Paramormyrops kingsleyae TaxID=1676925 RepID=UPI003B97883C